MALAIIAGILIFVFAIINPILKYFGKGEIDYDYALPGGFFLIMCYLAYELHIPFTHVFIIFGFGLAVGSFIENIAHKKKNEKN